jgi:hypothetical protein
LTDKAAMVDEMRAKCTLADMKIEAFAALEAAFLDFKNKFQL